MQSRIPHSSLATLPSILGGILCALAAVPAVQAQIPLTATYSEAFNNIDAAKTANAYPWTDNSTIPGWYAAVNGKPAPQFRVTKGGTASVTPSVWIVRTVPTEAALGSISGTKADKPVLTTFGAAFVNKTGKTITSLDIAYHGEQWGHGPGGADKLVFEYSLNATSLDSGTWTAEPKLNFNAPLTANSMFAGVDGNVPANSANIKASLSGLSIAPGATFWIRWAHPIVEGGNQGLAVDDFTLTPQVQ
ncbi:MAG: hypothetical protein PHQ12_00730 [Chthoniobacteraceae bacterium]|nr:hypothetical protein [Chthoniobacteraceae bacterium]